MVYFLMANYAFTISAAVVAMVIVITIGTLMRISKKDQRDN